MQTRERLFERGYSTTAALMLIAILGLGAVVLDSANVALNSEAQVAQAAGAAAGNRRCINNSRYKIAIGTNDGAAPTMTGAQLPPQPGTADQPGCYVQFCASREPAANDANQSRETCTEERFFLTTIGLHQATSDNVTATTYFAQDLTSEIGQLAANDQSNEVLRGLRLSTAQSDILDDAFQNIYDEQAYNVSVAQINNQEALLAASQCTTDCTELEDRAQATQEAFDRDQAVLYRLQEQSQALENNQAVVQEAAPPPGAPQNCPGGPGCQGGTWNPQTGTFTGAPEAPPLDAAERDRITRECVNGSQEACRRLQSAGLYQPGQQPPPGTPPPSSCSGLSNLFGLCNNNNNQLGGSNYCVTSTFPLVVAPGPWRPGCLNNPNQQQQCGALQQIISGCPNPFSPLGQQQCGGLMLMLNKCPAGSYNPNNPSNPYNYPTPTCSIQASPASVSAAGQATTLQWRSQGASYASLSNSGQVGPSGSMTVYPQSPTTYTMTVVGQGNQQGRCQTQVGIGSESGANGPAAQLSCQPQVADVGMQVAISFACQNAATSAGSGFSTGGALSGSVTTTIASPTLGASTVVYGLTCFNQGQIHSAQCTINVNKTAIVLVANPKTIASGGEANIGWVTSGMDSCVISSSNAAFTAANASSTNVSGAAQTPALTQTTSFLLSCNTKTGGTKTASTTVHVSN